MDLPLSGNQLKKLTKRYREGTLQPGDQELLDSVLRCYAVVLHRAHEEVERLCADLPNTQPMAPRVKTRKTTLEKLHRQPHLHSITQIRDLAGLRVVVHGTRSDQDVVVARLADHFGADGRPVKTIDRRVDPRQGYRAVHLEVEHSGLKVEIQVRTDLQHDWAESFERLADRLGRGLRYGEHVELDRTGATWYMLMNLVSGAVDNVERKSGASSEDQREALRRLMAQIRDLVHDEPGELP